MDIRKLTCNDEYEKALDEKSNLKQKLFNIKLEIEYNKKNIDKYNLLKEKEKIIKNQIAKLSYSIVEYESNNDIVERRKK